MKKVLKYLSLTIPVLVAIGIIFVATILCISIYYQSYIGAIIYKTGITSLGTKLNYIPELSEAYLQILNYLIPISWAVLFFFWYKKLIGKKVEPKIRLFTLKNIVLLALLSVACQLVIIGLMELTLPHFEKIAQDYNELMSQVFNGNPILIFISIAILAPISEELIFRGVILKKACQFSPFIVANILQALLFGIFHMNIVQGVYAIGAGLVMGYVAYKYKTIMASILLHFFFNLSSYIMKTPTTDYMKVIYIVIGVILMIYALSMIKKVETKNPSYSINNDAIIE